LRDVMNLIKNYRFACMKFGIGHILDRSDLKNRIMTCTLEAAINLRFP
jgi:hypothetical protein